MSASDYLFTSESVAEGHPDKVCDQISDAIVDAYLGADPQARVAAEALATTNRLIIAGEVRGPHEVIERIDELARGVIRRIGYEQDGFHWQTCAIDVLLHEQSADIAQGVDADSATQKEEGAGDQGIMFGYACRETPELMPAPILYAHKILRLMAEDRRSGRVPFGPDAKSQVTLRYVDGKPVGCTSVVVSTQHEPHVSQADVRELVRPYVARVLPEGWFPPEDEFYVNPTGKFVIGGPDGDAGLTGRKIIVDTYGGAAPHGGGAFSGKDPTKVDRSAAYAARYLAKNVVASGLAEACTIQLSYAIGVAWPLSVYINTHGSSRVENGRLAPLLRELVDLSPRGIRSHLGLNRPIYERSAAYGHFGREPDHDGGFSWERTDLVPELLRHFN